MSHSHCARSKEIYLPNEILAKIMNELVSDAKTDDDRTLLLPTLTSCRIASPVFYSLATPILFSSIRLVEAPWNDELALQERAIKLKEILATTSDISTSVHTLTLGLLKANLKNSLTGTLISEIIHQLPHIQTFILKSGRGSFGFTEISGDLASAIKSLCKSPNLRTLDLENIIHLPITVITACPNLQCLRFSAPKFPFEATKEVSSSSLEPYNLDSLQVDYSRGRLTSFNNDISFVKRFLRIKNLQLKNVFCDFSTLGCGWDIMIHASQSLTTLDLPWDDKLFYTSVFSHAYGIVPFNLGRFPALRHFKIQVRISFLEDNIIMLYGLHKFLSISRYSKSGIETLEIMITWENVSSGGQRKLFSPAAGWSILDEVLSSEKFVSLQKIVLKLVLNIKRVDCGASSQNYTHWEFGRDLTLAYVDALFPRLRALEDAQLRTLEIHVETKV